MYQIILEKTGAGLTMLKPDWLSASAILTHMRQTRLIGWICVMPHQQPIPTEPCGHVQSGVILKLPVLLLPALTTNKKKINNVLVLASAAVLFRLTPVFLNSVCLF